MLTADRLNRTRYFRLLRRLQRERRSPLRSHLIRPHQAKPRQRQRTPYPEPAASPLRGQGEPLLQCPEHGLCVRIRDARPLSHLQQPPPRCLFAPKGRESPSQRPPGSEYMLHTRSLSIHVQFLL